MALRGDDFVKICDLSKGVSESKLFVAVAWVFMLRAHSEASGLIRVSDNDRALDPFLPPAHPAVVGCVSEEVIRLERRKNRPRGDFIRRGCVCTTKLASSNHCYGVCCPVCVLWAVIKRKVAVGKNLFGDGVSKRAEIWLQQALTEKGVDRADRFTLHSLRRGAAREMVRKGGTAADLCVAGSWGTEKALRRYLDIQEIESSVVKKFMGESSYHR